MKRIKKLILFLLIVVCFHKTDWSSNITSEYKIEVCNETEGGSDWFPSQEIHY